MNIGTTVVRTIRVPKPEVAPTFDPQRVAEPMRDPVRVGP